MYDVRYDIDTGDMYYYHILKKTKQQLKPRIMGHDKLTPPDYARVRNEKNVALYVVFEREAREFQSFHTFMFQLRHMNMMRIAHSYRKKVTRKSTLEYKLDYDEHITRASRSNTGTWNMQ